MIRKLLILVVLMTFMVSSALAILPWGSEKFVAPTAITITGASEFYVVSDGEVTFTVTVNGEIWPRAGDNLYYANLGATFHGTSSGITVVTIVSTAGSYGYVTWK